MTLGLLVVRRRCSKLLPMDVGLLQTLGLQSVLSFSHTLSTKLTNEHKQQRQHLKERQHHRNLFEVRQRQTRLSTGLKGVWDWLSGKAKEAIRQQNQLDAREALKRDQLQKDNLIHAQLKERQRLQQEIKHLKTQHKQEQKNLNHIIGQVLKVEGRKALNIKRTKAMVERQTRDKGIRLER